MKTNPDEMDAVVDAFHRALKDEAFAARRSLSVVGLMVLALWFIFIWAIADVAFYSPPANAIW